MTTSAVQQHTQIVRVRLALKVMLGATLCAIINALFHLDMGYLSSLLVAIVLVVFHGRTLRIGIPGVLGILIAGSVQAMLTVLLHDTPAAYGLCSMLWLFVWMAFLSSLPLAHLVGGILIAMIPFTYALGLISIQALVQAFWLQCILALVVSIALDRLLWPAKPEDTYFEALATLLNSFADDVNQLVSIREIRPRSRDAHSAEVRGIAQLANLSKGVYAGGSDAMMRLNLACRMIWQRVQLGEQFMSENDKDVFTDIESRRIKTIFTGLARHYRLISQAAPAQKMAPPLDAEIVAAIRGLIENLRTGEGNPSLRTTSMDSSAAMVRHLERALESHALVVDSYNEILSALAAKRSRILDVTAVLKQIFSPPSRQALQSAGRIVLIVLCLFIAVVYMKFPGSSLVAFYGISFGLTSNVGQLYMRGRSGVLGVLAGITMGMAGVLIVTHSPNFPVLLGVFAIAMFLAADASTAPDPVGFAGLQAALITPYVFLIYEGPLWTVENAMTRVAALVVAAAVAMIVQRIAWPQDPLLIFRTVVAETLDRIEEAWERLRKGEDTTPGHPSVAVKFDTSVTLLRDARYVIGTHHPLASTYLNLLRSLQDTFASMQTMRQLLGVTENDALIQQSMREVAPQLLIVTRALEEISRRVRNGKGALEGLVGQLAEVRWAGQRIRLECPAGTPPETRSHCLVLGTLLCEIADSLIAAVAAARAMPAVAPLSMLGSSEGWQASARTNPSH